MKRILAILTIAGFLAMAGCGLFESSEAVRHESSRTVYRAGDENPADLPETTPSREKVPGETR